MRATPARFILAAMTLAVVAAPANAQIDLGHPTASSSTSQAISNSPVGDRSVVFNALTSFSITSAGIFIDPIRPPTGIIQANLYQMIQSGGLGTRGALLTSGQLNFTDVGAGFYDVPLTFALLAGQRYDIGFQSIVPAGWGTGGVYSMEFYFFDNPSGGPGYNVAGMVEVLDGGADQDGGYGNFAMPHVRLNDVAVTATPEPASMLLMGTGLLGVIAAARRRRMSA